MLFHQIYNNENWFRETIYTQNLHRIHILSHHRVVYSNDHDTHSTCSVAVALCQWCQKQHFSNVTSHNKMDGWLVGFYSILSTQAMTKKSADSVNNYIDWTVIFHFRKLSFFMQHCLVFNSRKLSVSTTFLLSQWKCYFIAALIMSIQHTTFFKHNVYPFTSGWNILLKIKQLQKVEVEMDTEYVRAMLLWPHSISWWLTTNTHITVI